MNSLHWEPTTHQMGNFLAGCPTLYPIRVADLWGQTKTTKPTENRLLEQCLPRLLLAWNQALKMHLPADFPFPVMQNQVLWETLLSLEHLQHLVLDRLDQRKRKKIPTESRYQSQVSQEHCQLPVWTQA